MLDTETKKRIDTARAILVGKVPDPKSQVEQITIALIYKFMDDMDNESVSFGGEATFFSGKYKKYSWTKIFDTKIGGHEMLELYSKAIEELNTNPNIPQLFRDIFKNAYLPYRDPETLKLFLKTINEFHYDHSEKLGDAFEYLLSVLGSQGDAGQFRTPRHIIDFIVEVLQPKKNETICDPACGTAGFLISSYKYILKDNTKKNIGDKLTPEERTNMMNNIKGYDISPDMVRLSLANMYLHGFSTPSIHEYDTLTSEEKWNEYYDVILANPPFMSPKGGIKPHKKFSIQANRSEVLFVDYIAEHIHPGTGRAGIIVPEGIIFQGGNAYKSLRKMLVDKEYLYAVVSLPAGIFQPYSGVKTSILLMDKSLAKKSDNILFVKIDNDGFDLGAQRRAIDKNDLTTALELLNQYKLSLQNNTTFNSDNKNVFIVEKEKISRNGDYILSIERYRVNENIQKSNFEIVKLGDIAEVISGQSPESEFYNDQNLGMPFYQGRTEFGDIHIGDPKIWTTKITKKAIKGDILMSVRAPVGPVNISTQEVCIGRGIAAIRPNDKIMQSYLFRLLRSIQNDIRGNGGAVFDSINRNQIMNLEIPLPPLPIQQEIVTKIESYQKIIDGAKQIVENYKPQIDIDESWEMVKLGEVCEITSSKRIFQNEYVNSGIPFYRTKEIVELNKGDEISLELFISEERYNDIESKFDIPKKGDLLVSAVGTIGIVWVIPDNRKFYFKDGNLIWIKNLKEIEPFYLKILLENAFSFRMAELTNGAAYNALTIIKLKQLEIPNPPLTIQQEIVTRIEQEQQMVDSNKELIRIFEGKIKDEVDKLWVKNK
ncbi:MAG TPA: N-6 DNA methylase [Ignavibacteria bacterium]|nr:N-6 DNA methylase [Ignavibacteria bacterium]HMR41552.1 N-6 DNA methylase [Ignavibacteria bacterium]